MLTYATSSLAYATNKIPTDYIPTVSIPFLSLMQERERERERESGEWRESGERERMVQAFVPWALKRERERERERGMRLRRLAHILHLMDLITGV